MTGSIPGVAGGPKPRRRSATCSRIKSAIPYGGLTGNKVLPKEICVDEPATGRLYNRDAFRGGQYVAGNLFDARSGGGTPYSELNSLYMLQSVCADPGDPIELRIGRSARTDTHAR